MTLRNNQRLSETVSFSAATSFGVRPYRRSIGLSVINSPVQTIVKARGRNVRIVESELCGIVQRAACQCNVFNVRPHQPWFMICAQNWIARRHIGDDALLCAMLKQELPVTFDVRSFASLLERCARCIIHIIIELNEHPLMVRTETTATQHLQRTLWRNWLPWL